MGQIYYGSVDLPIQVADELLAYVRLIANAKLRNNESFMLSWHHDDEESGDRSSVWLNQAIPLRFVFDAPARIEIDQERLAHLRDGANRGSGLVLPVAPARSVAAPDEVDGSAERMQRGAHLTRRPTDVPIFSSGG